MILRIAESSSNTLAALLEFLKPCSRADIFVTDPLAHRAKQQVLQCSAMDRNLRPAISRCQSPRFAMDQLPELVTEVQALRADPGLSKSVAEPELGQLTNRRRL